MDVASVVILSRLDPSVPNATFNPSSVPTTVDIEGSSCAGCVVGQHTAEDR